MLPTHQNHLPQLRTLADSWLLRSPVALLCLSPSPPPHLASPVPSSLTPAETLKPGHSWSEMSPVTAAAAASAQGLRAQEAWWAPCGLCYLGGGSVWPWSLTDLLNSLLTGPNTPLLPASVPQCAVSPGSGASLSLLSIYTHCPVIHNMDDSVHGLMLMASFAPTQPFPDLGPHGDPPASLVHPTHLSGVSHLPRPMLDSGLPSPQTFCPRIHPIH